MIKIRKLVCYVRNFKVHSRWSLVKNITPIGIYQVNDGYEDDVYVLINKKRVDNFGDICDAIYKAECAYHQQWLRDNKITEILLK